MDYTNDWLWERMRSEFRVESMSQVEPALLLQFATEHDIAQYLPQEYL